MSKIGDLWVRLGLKKEGFDRGLDEGGRKLSSFASKMKGLKTLAVGIWAAIGAAALKAAADFALSSQKFGDEWNKTMSGMKAAWSTFLSALTSWDWDKFTDRIRESFKAAKKAADVSDEETEVMNSIDRRKAAMQEELAQLRILSQNTNVSYKQRAQAAQDYLDKVKPLYDEEAKMRQKVATAETNKWLAQAGLRQTQKNRELVDQFIQNVAPQGDLMRQLTQEYNKNVGKKYTLSRQDNSDLDEFYKSIGNDAEAMAAFASMASFYQSTNDKRTSELVTALNAADAANAAFDEETRRIQSSLNTALSNLDKGSGSGTKETLVDPWLEYTDAISKAAQKAAQEAAEIQAAQNEINESFDEFNEKFRDKKGLDSFTDFMDQSIINQDLAGSWKAFVEGITDAADEAAEQEQRLIDIAKDFNANVAQGIADGCQYIMDSLMGLEEFNAGSLLKALLTPLADMAVREGEILVASGLGIEAIKKALESLNGLAAVTAGLSLIAVGTAAKSGLAALAKNGASSTTATTSGYSGGGSFQQDLKTEMTIYVTGKISGNDIELSGQRTINDWSR